MARVGHRDQLLGRRAAAARGARVRPHHRPRPGRGLGHQPGQHRLPLRVEGRPAQRRDRAVVRRLGRAAGRAGHVRHRRRRRCSGPAPPGSPSLQALPERRSMLQSYVEALAQGAAGAGAARRSWPSTTRRARTMVAELVALTLGEGIRADDPRCRAVASLVIAACDGLAVQWLLDPEDAPDPQATGRRAGRGAERPRCRNWPAERTSARRRSRGRPAARRRGRPRRPRPRSARRSEHRARRGWPKRCRASPAISRMRPRPAW